MSPAAAGKARSAIAVATSTTVTASVATTTVRVGAVTSHMSNFAALITFLPSSLARASALGAVTRDMSSNATLVACFSSLLSLRTATTHVAFFVAIIAPAGATSRAIASLLEEYGQW